MGFHEVAPASSSVHVDEHRCFLKLETSYQTLWLRLGPDWLYWIDRFVFWTPFHCCQGGVFELAIWALLVSAASSCSAFSILYFSAMRA